MGGKWFRLLGLRVFAELVGGGDRAGWRGGFRPEKLEKVRPGFVGAVSRLDTFARGVGMAAMGWPCGVGRYTAAAATRGIKDRAEENR
jgi:hypothetical protein